MDSSFCLPWRVRTDEYGGSREPRFGFITNIIQRIRELCGNDFPIVVKLSAAESGKDVGITVKDGIYYAKDCGMRAWMRLKFLQACGAVRKNTVGSSETECQTTGLCGYKQGGFVK